MNNYSCIIVDDEPLARKIISDHASELSELSLMGEFKSAIEARSYLENQNIDIIFLDINMPKLTGIEFLKTIDSPSLIIFTTAYPEHAVDAFEFNAFDYLVKPISFQRFYKSIEKVKKHLAPSENLAIDSITVKENKRLYKIDFDTILYIEAYGDYVKIHTKEKTYTVKDKLSNYARLAQHNFLRIHRSHIIRMDKIEFVEGNQVSIAGIKLPISGGYKEAFFGKYNT